MKKLLINRDASRQTGTLNIASIARFLAHLRVPTGNSFSSRNATGENAIHGRYQAVQASNMEISLEGNRTKSRMEDRAPIPIQIRSIFPSPGYLIWIPSEGSLSGVVDPGALRGSLAVFSSIGASISRQTESFYPFLAPVVLGSVLCQEPPWWNRPDNNIKVST